LSAEHVTKARRGGRTRDSGTLAGRVECETLIVREPGHQAQEPVGHGTVARPEEALQAIDAERPVPWLGDELAQVAGNAADAPGSLA